MARVITERMRRRRQAQLVRPTTSTFFVLFTFCFFPLEKIWTPTDVVYLGRSWDQVWLCRCPKSALAMRICPCPSSLDCVGVDINEPPLASPRLRRSTQRQRRSHPATALSHPASLNFFLIGFPRRLFFFSLSRGAPTGQTQATDRSIRRRPVAPNEGQAGERAPVGG